MIDEAYLSCINSEANRVLYCFDSRLYRKKCLMASSLGEMRVPFKTLGLVIVSDDSPSPSAAAAIGYACELAFRQYPEECSEYRESFLNRLSRAQAIEIAMPSHASFRLPVNLASQLLEVKGSQEACSKRCQELEQLVSGLSAASVQNEARLGEQREVCDHQLMTITELEGRIKLLTVDNMGLQESLGTLASKLSETEGQLAEAEQRIDASGHAILTKQEEMCSMAALIEQQQKEMETLRTEGDGLKGQLLEETSRNTDEKKRIAGQFVDFKRKALQERGQLSEELAVTQVQLKQAAEELHVAKADLHGKEQEVRRLEAELQATRNALEQKEELLRRKHLEFEELISVPSLDKEGQNTTAPSQSQMSCLIDFLSVREEDEFVSV